jgi:hypothetical protein
MSDQRFYNMVLKFSEKYNLDLPPKCYDCGGDLIPESIEDVEELCAIIMVCCDCGSNPAVIGSKENGIYDEDELNMFLNSLEDNEDE